MRFSQNRLCEVRKKKTPNKLHIVEMKSFYSIIFVSKEYKNIFAALQYAICICFVTF